jgi:hypothetical protein
MANRFIITETYNPDRKVKYQWEIRSDKNNLDKIKIMFKKHDAEDPSLFSKEAWGWDSEQKCFTTELGDFDHVAQFAEFDLNDKYESMREDNRDTFDDLIGNQMYQYRNMIYFTAKNRNGIDICRGVIQSDGSHDLHGVSLFSEKEFLRPFTMDLR